ANQRVTTPSPWMWLRNINKNVVRCVQWTMRYTRKRSCRFLPAHILDFNRPLQYVSIGGNPLRFTSPFVQREQLDASRWNGGTDLYGNFSHKLLLPEIKCQLSFARIQREALELNLFLYGLCQTSVE